MIFSEKINMKKTGFIGVSVLRVTSISALVTAIAAVLAYLIGRIVDSIQFSPILKEPATVLSLIAALISVILFFGNIIRVMSRKKIARLENLLEKSDHELLESVESNTLSLLRERRNLNGR